MIHQNLTSLRRLNGLTQEELAERLGVSRQAVAKWEGGKTAPDIANCVALAKLYGVSLDDLVAEGKETPFVPIPPEGKHLFGVVTLGEEGQLALPKKARDLFGLKAGDGIVVLGDEERGIALMKADEMMEFYRRLGEVQEEK